MTPEELAFNQNLLYPLILLLVGGLMTGILIPWYTNRQKNKQNEIEKLRSSIELDKNRKQQDYQFKIKLKQELVNSFHNYWITTISVIVNFQAGVFDHFSIGPMEKIEDKPGQRSSLLEIHDKDGKYPIDVFLKNWKDLLKQVGRDSSKHSNYFLLKLSWYSDNQELVKEFEELRDRIREITIIESNLINCKDQSEFFKYNQEMTKETEEITENLKIFRYKLVQLKFKEILV